MASWGPGTVLPLLSTAGGHCSSRRWSWGSQPSRPTPHRGFHPGSLRKCSFSTLCRALCQLCRFFPSAHTAPEGPDVEITPIFWLRCLLTISPHLLLISELRLHLVPFSGVTPSLTTFCGILCTFLHPHVHQTSSFRLRVRLGHFLPLSR